MTCQFIWLITKTANPTVAAEVPNPQAATAIATFRWFGFAIAMALASMAAIKPTIAIAKRMTDICLYFQF